MTMVELKGEFGFVDASLAANVRLISYRQAVECYRLPSHGSMSMSL